MIRIVVATVPTLHREGLKVLLDRAGEITVVGEARDGDAALRVVGELAPDVVVTSRWLPLRTGLQVAEHLSASGNGTGVLLVSDDCGPSFVREALAAGVRGLVLLDATVNELVWAVHVVHSGETYLSPVVASTVSRLLASGRVDGTGAGGLSDREREVMQMVACGLTNRDIAQRLSLSPRTVEKHRASFMRKLGLNCVADVVREALRRGWLSEAPPPSRTRG